MVQLTGQAYHLFPRTFSRCLGHFQIWLQKYWLLSSFAALRSPWRKVLVPGAPSQSCRSLHSHAILVGQIHPISSSFEADCDFFGKVG